MIDIHMTLYTIDELYNVDIFADGQDKTMRHDEMENHLYCI